MVLEQQRSQQQTHEKQVAKRKSLKTWLGITYHKLQEYLVGDKTGRLGRQRSKDIIALAQFASLDTYDGQALTDASSLSRYVIEQLKNQDMPVRVTEDLVAAIAKMTYRGRDAMEALLHRSPRAVFTQRVLEIAVDNRIWGAEIVELLLDQVDDAMITIDLVLRAMKNTSNGRETMRVLLKRERGLWPEANALGDSVSSADCTAAFQRFLETRRHAKVTEAALTSACALHNSSDIVRLLLNHESGVEITEAIIKCAIGHANAPEVISMLLSYDKNIEITEGTISAAIVGYGGLKVVPLLLNYRKDIGLTNECLVAATRSPVKFDLIQCLLRYADDNGVDFDEQLITAATQSSDRAELLLWLLEHRDDFEPTNCMLTEAVKVAQSTGLVRAILAYDKHRAVTEAMLVAAACRPKPLDMLQMLLAHNRKILASTGASGKASATSDRFIGNLQVLMVTLFSRGHGDAVLCLGVSAISLRDNGGDLKQAEWATQALKEALQTPNGLKYLNEMEGRAGVASSSSKEISELELRPLLQAQESLILLMSAGLGISLSTIVNITTDLMKAEDMMHYHIWPCAPHRRVYSDKAHGLQRKLLQAMEGLLKTLSGQGRQKEARVLLLSTLEDRKFFANNPPMIRMGPAKAEWNEFLHKVQNLGHEGSRDAQ